MGKKCCSVIQAMWGTCPALPRASQKTLSTWLRIPEPQLLICRMKLIVPNTCISVFNGRGVCLSVCLSRAWHNRPVSTDGQLEKCSSKSRLGVVWNNLWWLQNTLQNLSYGIRNTFQTRQLSSARTEGMNADICGTCGQPPLFALPERTKVVLSEIWSLAS